jgi:hypothetical protein
MKENNNKEERKVRAYIDACGRTIESNSNVVYY